MVGAIVLPALLGALIFLTAVSDVLSIVIGQPLRHALRKVLPPSLWECIPSWLCPRWVSNIPGSPYRVCDFTIASVAPFPEANDHNALLAGAPLPCVLKGRAPQAEYWSIQAFIKGSEAVTEEQILCDREIAQDADGNYALALCSAAERTAAIKAGRAFPPSWIDTGSATTCMIGMRAFKVPNGRAWLAPQLRSLDAIDGPAWPLADTERVAGPLATESSVRASALLLVVAAAVALAFELVSVWLLVQGVAVAALLRLALLHKFATKYAKMVGARGAANATVTNASARHSLKGSAKHTYYSMAYDCRHHDVEVRGVLSLPDVLAPGVPAGPGAFRYTSVTAYKYNSLPLPSYLDGASLTPDAKDASTFTVRLTRTPTGAPNEINVADAPTGVCVVRLVYPINEEVVAACKPSIRAVAPRDMTGEETALSPGWRLFFMLAGVSNLLQAALHFATRGGTGSLPNRLLGFTPSILHALLHKLGLARIAPMAPEWMGGAYDTFMWGAVGLAGAAYWVHGRSRGVHPALPAPVVLSFGLMKYQVAGTCLLLWLAGTHGDASMPIFVLESCLGTAFLGYALLAATSPVGEGSVVRMRNIFHVLNAVAGRLQLLPFPVEKLRALHEQALEAEKKAFGDSADVTAAKRALFEIQVEGVVGEGNRFTPLGRLMLSKDIAKRYTRRLRFATLLLEDAGACAKSKRAVRKPLIIAGLPRTGSTFLHRLLDVDTSSRSPLWWEQMHNDADVTPPAADALLTDARIEGVKKTFASLSAISPNALREFYKFHRMLPTDAEECAPFLRRYYWDMEGASMQQAALDKRSAWVESPSVDRSFLATELKRWLALHGPEEDDVTTQWVLKAPLFTTFLPELAVTFPDASFVFTTRDPIQLMPSTCGMAESAASLSQRYGDGLHPLGKAVAARMLSYAEQQLAFCSTPPAAIKPPLVLKYKELIADPMGAVRRIYAHAGRTLTEGAAEAMTAHLKDNQQHKEGRPDYSLAKFGLEKPALQQLFAKYIAIV